ncbi:hypothetical protein [Streptomyces sp. SAS_270]|uniref:hypothetical protein n=1 Tax=Streptomyces sp. SAS_270 TaxID=3412748 RepID=UPI00403D2D2B
MTAAVAQTPPCDDGHARCDRREHRAAQGTARSGAIGLLLGGMLTEWASWRCVMYVNVVFAAPALIGALLLLAKPVITKKPGLSSRTRRLIRRPGLRRQPRTAVGGADRRPAEGSGETSGVPF